MCSAYYYTNIKKCSVCDTNDIITKCINCSNSYCIQCVSMLSNVIYTCTDPFDEWGGHTVCANCVKSCELCGKRTCLEHHVDHSMNTSPSHCEICNKYCKLCS